MKVIRNGGPDLQQFRNLVGGDAFYETTPGTVWMKLETGSRAVSLMNGFVRAFNDTELVHPVNAEVVVKDGKP